MSGYYLMHRGWQQNPAFNDEAFSRRDAWVWLIENANFAPGRLTIHGKTVAVERGQVSRSLRTMAREWKWDDAKVRRFLSRLESEGMIACVADAGQTVVTISNYNIYQFRPSVTDAPTDAAPTRHRRSSDALHKEGNEYITPYPLSGDSPSKTPRQDRGSRLAADWTLPAEWRQWALDEGCADPDREAAKFADYWHARPGAKGRMADWLGTWRNWIRRSLDNVRPGAPTSSVQKVLPIAADARRSELLARAKMILAGGNAVASAAQRWPTQDFPEMVRLGLLTVSDLQKVGIQIQPRAVG